MSSSSEMDSDSETTDSSEDSSWIEIYSFGKNIPFFCFTHTQNYAKIYSLTWRSSISDDASKINLERQADAPQNLPYFQRW